MALGLGSAGAAAADFIVLGFTSARGGDYALSSGSQISEYRDAFYPSFFDHASADLGSFTQTLLNSNVQVVLISSQRTANGAISPLSTSEQQVLMDFILSGRGAILFVENHQFAGSASDPANESLIDAFGLDVAGNVATTLATVVDASSPLADGPFGQVTTFRISGAGAFTSLGPYAQVVGRASPTSEAVLAVIPRDAIAPGSGPVVLFSDTTMVIPMWFDDNKTLLLNAIAYAACLYETANAPQIVRACAGGELVLHYAVAGAGPVSYEWQHGGVPLNDGTTTEGALVSGAATATLTISNCSPADAGQYTCTASNGCATTYRRATDVTIRQLGDANCDCDFDPADIQAFLLALFDPAGYAVTFPGCDRLKHADMNGDGEIDAFDIGAFAALFEE